MEKKITYRLDNEEFSNFSLTNALFNEKITKLKELNIEVAKLNKELMIIDPYLAQLQKNILEKNKLDIQTKIKIDRDDDGYFFTVGE